MVDGWEVGVGVDGVGRWVKGGEGVHDYSIQYVLFEIVTPSLWGVCAQSTETQEVTQFHITNWSPDGVCANLATITEVIKELDKVQRRTGNHPIVVHCRCLLPLPNKAALWVM